MKRCMISGLLLLAALGAFADPVILINTLPARPVFTVESQGVVLTRTVAPGNRVSLEAGFFSGLGEKKVPLRAGTTYYLARFGALPGLYKLDGDQVLILNQSGRAVSISLNGRGLAEGVLASGAIALGALGEEGLTVNWLDQQSRPEGGRVYRLILDSPDGVGTTVSLKPWD